MFIQVSQDDHATILAALRFYQEKGQGDPFNRSDAIHNIATNGDDGSITSLDDAGIDSLCHRLNFANANLQIIALAHESRSGTEIWSFETEEERRDWMLDYAKRNFGFVPASTDPEEIDEALTEEFNDCDEAIKWDYLPVTVRGALPTPPKVWAIAVDNKYGTCLEAYATQDAAWRGVLNFCTRDDFDASAYEFGSDEMKEAIRETLEEDNAWYVMEECTIADAPAAQPVPEICVILDGGLIQNVVARNASPVVIRTVDYDTEGGDEDEMTDVAQSDGKYVLAYVGGQTPELDEQESFWASIDGSDETSTEG